MYKPVYLLWNPRRNAYQAHQHGLYAYGDESKAQAECESLARHSPGSRVVEVIPSETVTHLDRELNEFDYILEHYGIYGYSDGLEDLLRAAWNAKRGGI